jgi:hypothetical protein
MANTNLKEGLGFVSMIINSPAGSVQGRGCVDLSSCFDNCDKDSCDKDSGCDRCNCVDLGSAPCDRDSNCDRCIDIGCVDTGQTSCDR